MRRRPGALLPLEIEILSTGIDFTGPSRSGFHGFAIAKLIRERSGARLLTAHGTLYKALRRLEKAGLLSSHWEDPRIAEGAGRPRRRLYQVTGAGERAMAGAQARSATPTRVRRPGEGLAPA